jgi:hypothetical protein
MPIDSTNAVSVVNSFMKQGQSARDTRISQFQKYERFILDGEQWDPGTEPELGSPVLSMNESEDYINTYLSKLFPRNPESGALEVGVRVRGPQREKYEIEILDTYKREKISATLLEQGQNFLVGGDACIYYPQDPVTKKARIFSIDPKSVYLNFIGNELVEFAFVDDISSADLDSSAPNFFQSALRFIMGQTEASTQRVTYWSKSVQIVKIGDRVEIRKNSFGFVPASWIPNRPKSHSHEGRSEGKGLYMLEQYNNEELSAVGKRVQDNTKAPLAVSTDRKTDDLQRTVTERSILPLEKGGSAEFLSLPESPELLKFPQYISSKMDKKMAVNDAVNGAVKSNVSSLAMMYYFSPLLDRISLKRVYWDQFFRDLNSAIILYAGGTPADCDTDPVYQSTMLMDRTTVIDNVVKMVQNRLMTVREAIDTLFPFENSAKKLREIEAEFDRLSALPGFFPTTAKASLNNPTVQPQSQL